MEEELQIDVRKLRLFNRMAREGGETVADHLGQMTGVATGAEVTMINFIDVADIAAHVGDHKQIGVSIELHDPPHGHLLFLVDAASAKRFADGMIGGMGETADAGFSDMEKSAIKEIGNVMASAFVDGWANVLETTIDFSTPTFTFGPGSDLATELVHARFDLALLFDSHITAEDADARLSVYMFPDLEELVDLMRRLDPPE
ncbi:MAG: chemotaxis protein CheC [Halobacteriaceae archaeon]